MNNCDILYKPPNTSPTYRSRRRPVWPAFVILHRAVQEDLAVAVAGAQPATGQHIIHKGLSSWGQACPFPHPSRRVERNRKGLSAYARATLATTEEGTWQGCRGGRRMIDNSPRTALSRSRALTRAETRRVSRSWPHVPAGAASRRGGQLRGGNRGLFARLEHHMNDFPVWR